MDGQDWRAAHQAQVAEDLKADNAARALDNARQKLKGLVADDRAIQADVLKMALNECRTIWAGTGGADVGTIWQAVSNGGESSGTSSSADSIREMLSRSGLSDDEAARLLDRFRELVAVENLNDPSTLAKVKADRVRRLREFHGTTQSEEWMKFFESLSLKRVTLLCSALRGHATDQDLGELLDERMLVELQQLEPLLQGFPEFVTTEVPEASGDDSESEWWATSPPPPQSGWHDKPVIGTKKELAHCVGVAVRKKPVDVKTLRTMHTKSVWIYRVHNTAWQAYFHTPEEFAEANRAQVEFRKGTPGGAKGSEREPTA